MAVGIAPEIVKTLPEVEQVQLTAAKLLISKVTHVGIDDNKV